MSFFRKKKEFFTGIVCFIFGLLVCFQADVLQNFYDLLLVIIVLGIFFVFVLYLFRKVLIMKITELVKDKVVNLFSPLRTTLDNIRTNKKPLSKMRFNDVVSLINILVDIYLESSFNKQLINVVLALFAILGGVLSFGELSKQNNLIREEIQRNGEVSVAQLKLDLKEDYINWRNDVPKMDEISDYCVLIGEDEYASRLEAYWSVIVRQEYEVLFLTDIESGGKNLSDVFKTQFIEKYKLALDQYNVLNIARKIYVCKRKKYFSNIDQPENFYKFLLNIEAFDLEECDCYINYCECIPAFMPPRNILGQDSAKLVVNY